MGKKQGPGDVSIGKFDILATYTYAKALFDGQGDDEARERGMVAAVMGAKARQGHRGSHQDDYKADKDAAEKKKKTTIAAESFDRQVADKMGGSFGKIFLPTMKKLVEAGLSYDEVKKLVKITKAWGPRSRASSFASGTPQHFETSRKVDPYGPPVDLPSGPVRGTGRHRRLPTRRPRPRQPGRVTTGPCPTPTGSGEPPR